MNLASCPSPRLFAIWGRTNREGRSGVSKMLRTPSLLVQWACQVEACFLPWPLPEPASFSLARLIPAGGPQRTGPETSKDEPLNQNRQQASESTRCAHQSQETVPWLAVQVEELPSGLHCRGLGGFISAEAGSTRPAGARPPPLRGLAGKLPDVGMTGFPEQCPLGI